MTKLVTSTVEGRTVVGQSSCKLENFPEADPFFTCVSSPLEHKAAKFVRVSSDLCFMIFI